MNAAIIPIIRRALLDLLFDIGGEQNHKVLALLLNELGHRLAEAEVEAQIDWLAEQKYIAAEKLGPFTVARIIANGRDVAEGRWVVAGISRFKTGD